MFLAAGPAHAVIPPGNLIANPGGESAPGATNASDSVAIPAWTKLTSSGSAFVPGGNFTTVQYAAGGGFPAPSVSSAIGGGANFFAGGPAEATSRIQQTVDASAAAAEIDAGSVVAALSADLGGFDGHDDNATVAVDYLSATGATSGTIQIGPVTASERNSVTTLLPRSATGAVPAGTRTMRVAVTATRFNPSYNDGYADNLSLTLARGAAPPTLGRTVNTSVVSGTVLVAVPAGSARAAQSVPGLKGVRFVPITEARQIPVGSLLDTRKGTVRLTSARDAKGATQNGDFTAGVFQVLQSRAAKSKGLTELRLKGSSFKNCTAKRSKRSQAATTADAQAAARRRLSRRTVRRLRSNAKGRFRTRGRYSSATVRGTSWTTTDRCDGTLTKVTRGSVTVRDIRRRKNITLRKGKSYLARARR